MKTLLGTFAALLFLAGSLSFAQSQPTQTKTLTCVNSQTQNSNFTSARTTSELTGVTDAFLISYLYMTEEVRLEKVLKTLSPEELKNQELAVLKTERDKVLARIRYATVFAHNNFGQKDCSMTDAEIYMIQAYSANYYLKINSVLRGDDTLLQQKYQPMLDTLNAGLAKLDAYRGEVLRGQTIHADVLDQYCIGCVITMRGYTSTSTMRPFSFPYTFKIKSETGRYIAPAAMIPGEREVLFAPGARFQIVSKKGNEFTMKEVK